MKRRVALEVSKHAKTVAYKAAVDAWATYRKNLQGLPKQPGFPFHIEWSQKPEN